MTPRIRRIVDWIVGLFLIGLGIACLVLPGPGLVLILAGLAVLSSHSRWAKSILDAVKQRARRVRDRVVRRSAAPERRDPPA